MINHVFKIVKKKHVFPSHGNHALITCKLQRMLMIPDLIHTVIIFCMIFMCGKFGYVCVIYLSKCYFKYISIYTIVTCICHLYRGHARLCQLQIKQF